MRMLGLLLSNKSNVLHTSRGLWYSYETWHNIFQIGILEKYDINHLHYNQRHQYQFDLWFSVRQRLLDEKHEGSFFEKKT